MNDDWREEFDNQFYLIDSGFCSAKDFKDIKQFISKEIERVREDILARVDKFIDANDDGLWTGMETAEKIRQIIQHPKGE